MSLYQRIYYVNTAFKSAGTNENFKYQLQIPSSQLYDRVVLLNASIPNSFYLIQSGYNKFTLKENATSVTITIPPGNYSAKTFSLILPPLLNAASPNLWTYSMSIPNSNIEASTGKFTYTVTGNSSQPSIVCDAQVNEQLGFIANTINTFASNSLTSTTTVNFTAESTLFLHSDISNSGDSDVLQEIYVGNTQSLSYITYLCQTADLYSKELRNNKSNVFNFSLTNEKKQLINLNGVDMQLTLCLYKRDDTNDLVRKYIQYKVQNESSQ